MGNFESMRTDKNQCVVEITSKHPRYGCIFRFSFDKSTTGFDLKSVSLKLVNALQSPQRLNELERQIDEYIESWKNYLTLVFSEIQLEYFDNIGQIILNKDFSYTLDLAYIVLDFDFLP